MNFILYVYLSWFSFIKIIAIDLMKKTNIEFEKMHINFKRVFVMVM
jgi:hypothetical protein